MNILTGYRPDPDQKKSPMITGDFVLSVAIA